MMSRHQMRLFGAGAFPRLVALLAITCALFAQGLAQTQTPGARDHNQRAPVLRRQRQHYSTVSNTVTVTVANVSGLAITPDAGSNPNLVAGQQNVDFVFRITNTGNFADQVRFLANGQSIRVVGAATVQSAVILGPNTNIFTNGSDVLSASIAQNGFIDVRVRVNVNANASVGSSVQVLLGDASTGTRRSTTSERAVCFDQRSPHGLVKFRQRTARSARRHYGDG